MIINPKYRFYNATVSKVITTAEGFDALVFGGCLFLSMGFIFSILFGFILSSGWFLTAALCVGIFLTFYAILKNSDEKVMYVGDLRSKFLRNDLKNLSNIISRYYTNLEKADDSIKEQVRIDEKALQEHAWTIATDLKSLQKFYGSGSDEDKPLTNSIVFESTLTDIKAEITKLEEMVKSLIAISVVESKAQIERRYVDPTIGDTLSHVASLRLTNHLELTSGNISLSSDE